jgi:hypothetical protein
MPPKGRDAPARSRERWTGKEFPDFAWRAAGARRAPPGREGAPLQEAKISPIPAVLCTRYKGKRQTLGGGQVSAPAGSRQSERGSGVGTHNPSQLPHAVGGTVQSTGPDLARGEPPSYSATPGADALPCIPGYDVLGEVGRGGMGIVYEARQVGLGRLVAVKMVLASPPAGPDEVARFRHPRGPHPPRAQLRRPGRRVRRLTTTRAPRAAYLRGIVPDPQPIAPRRMDRVRTHEALAGGRHPGRQRRRLGGDRRGHQRRPAPACRPRRPRPPGRALRDPPAGPGRRRRWRDGPGTAPRPAGPPEGPGRGLTGNGNGR